MMPRSRRLSVVVLLLVALPVTPAVADPITVVYDVHVSQRFLRQDAGPGVVDAVQEQFTLTMTFDSSPPTPAFGVYGAPSFSQVPLAVPSPPAAFPLARSGSTTHIALSTGGFFARAESDLFGSGLVDGNFTAYNLSVELRSSLLNSAPPLAVTPETFPFHLGLSGQNPLDPFNFSYSACLGVGPFGAGADSCTDATGVGTRIVSYQGTATLVESPPVPEPATLALVGSALAILASRRRRNKDGERNSGSIL